MVQVWKPIAQAIARDFKALHLKRNNYLNDLFNMEIAALDAEVRDPNPQGFYERLVHRQFQPHEKDKWTLELDLEVIERLNAVTEKLGIPRDSFINRVLFFLVANKQWLDRLGVAYERKGEVTAKPLADVRGFLQDPFFHIRGANDGLFYSLSWFWDGPVGKGGPNLFSLNVAMTQSDWEAMNAELDESFLDLGLTGKEGENHAD